LADKVKGMFRHGKDRAAEVGAEAVDKGAEMRDRLGEGGWVDKTGWLGW
jgi:hypothetical protein